jgi:hypothetical protein
VNAMITKCIECDHLIVDDETKYRHRGKAYIAKTVIGKDLQSQRKIDEY